MTKKDRIAELRRLSPWLTNVGDVIVYNGDIFGTIHSIGSSKLSITYPSGQDNFVTHLELAKGLVAGYYDIMRVDKDGEWSSHALAMLNQQLINE